MKFPELALFARRMDGNCRRFGKLMIFQRKILKNEFYVLGVFLEHLLEYRHQPSTVQSLEIVKRGNHYRCINWSFKRRAFNTDVMDKIKGDDLNRGVFAAGKK